LGKSFKNKKNRRRRFVTSEKEEGEEEEEEEIHFMLNMRMSRTPIEGGGGGGGGGEGGGEGGGDYCLLNISLGKETLPGGRPGGKTINNRTE
jgi:hypothetical protein